MRSKQMSSLSPYISGNERSTLWYYYRFDLVRTWPVGGDLDRKRRKSCIRTFSFLRAFRRPYNVPFAPGIPYLLYPVPSHLFYRPKEGRERSLKNHAGQLTASSQ